MSHKQRNKEKNRTKDEELEAKYISEFIQIKVQ